MTNKQILSNSIAQWVTPIAQEVLPNINISKLGWANKFIGGMLGIDLSNYNIWNEFSFLFNDLIGEFITPQIDSALNNLHISDDKIPEFYPKILDSCINRCREVNYINVFGLQFNEISFQNLKNILDNNLSNANRLAPRKGNPVVEENPAAVGQQGQTMEG